MDVNGCVNQKWQKSLKGKVNLCVIKVKLYVLYDRTQHLAVLVH